MDLQNKKIEDIYREIAIGKLPAKSVLVDLIAKDPERYVQALSAKALIDISTISGDLDYIQDTEELELLKLRLSHLKFMTERLLPTVFGTRIEVTTVAKERPADSEIQKLIDSAKHETFIDQEIEE